MMEWLLIVLVLLLLLGGLGAVKFVEARRSLKPEEARKAAHVYVGCVTLFLPLWFDERWPVIVIGVFALSLMVFVRYVSQLKKSVGSILHAVQRDSFGELYFPVAVVLLFVLSHEQPVFYVIPLLILTFADASAALVGVAYGKHNMASGEEDRKSIEGGVTFLLIAFLCTLLPLLIASNIDPLNMILIALIISVLVTIVESVAYKGSDNLLIPLLTYAFLITHFNEPLQWLLAQLLVVVAIALFLYIWNKKSIMSRLGVMNALVSSYLIVLLGGWDWYVAPLLFFIFYPFLPRLTAEEKQRILDYHIVANYTLAGLIWLFVGVLVEAKAIFFIGFLAAFTIYCGIAAYIRFHIYRHFTQSKSIAYALLKAVLLCFVPGAFAYQGALSIAGSVLIVLAVLAGVALVSNSAVKQHNVRNFAITFLLSGLTIAIHELFF